MFFLKHRNIVRGSENATLKWEERKPLSLLNRNYWRNHEPEPRSGVQGLRKMGTYLKKKSEPKWKVTFFSFLLSLYFYKKFFRKE